jgi:uncharacterized membrane protein YeaQ/YmgE (transglycosylase-associated protein family)
MRALSIDSGSSIAAIVPRTNTRIRFGNRCARAPQAQRTTRAFGTRIAVGSHRIQREFLATRASSGVHAMNMIIWLVVGGVVGWLASVLMRTDAQQGVVLNVVVGIVGAALAGLFISPLVGMPTINQGVLSAGSFLVSLLGAVVLLAVVNLFRRGTAR